MTENLTNSNFHIFLDMDGVLSNFVGGCEKVFKTDLSELSQWRIDKHLGLNAAQFWGRIEEEKYFWAELEPYPWARELVNTCMELTKGNVTICTSPSTDPNCAAQKVYWIAKNFPGLNRAFLIGPQKYLLAKPNHILIDDSDDNLRKFKEAGGYAVAFPQLWNRTGFNFYKSQVYAWDYIREQIEAIFVQNINKE